MEKNNLSNNNVMFEISKKTNVSNSEFGQYSNSRLTAAVFFAFFPTFGIFGIHNFILKQYGRGIAHVAIVVVCYTISIIISMLCNHDRNCDSIAMIPQYLTIIPYIWSIIEGMRILRYREQTMSSSSTEDSVNIAQPPKSIMNAGETSYFVASQPSLEAVTKNEQKEKQDCKTWSVLSIIATIIPIMLWTYCFVSSGGGVEKSGYGAVWMLIGIYYWSLGIPLMVISIVFGVKGLKTSFRWLSIISLLLKAVMIVVIALLLFNL